MKQWAASLTTDQAAAVLYDWTFWARPEQQTPLGNWSTWLYMGGRGTGKSRTGAEFIRAGIEHAGNVALVGRTTGDPRDIMIEAKSGLLNIFPPHQRPVYQPSRRKITFYNGAVAHTYSADEPDQLRGPEHALAWCDELASWRYGKESWDNLQLGMRAGYGQPRVIVTTTPRPTTFMRSILGEPETVLTHGSTYLNRFNLPPAFIAKIRARYEGTPLARQELYGEIIEDSPMALWTREVIDQYRVIDVPDLSMIVVAVDPATTSKETSDDTGIVVVGRQGDAVSGHLFVLDDSTVSAAKPDQWAREAIAAYNRHQADGIVAEVNQGGEMVISTLNVIDSTVPTHSVNASRGKRTRAEPIAALYTQGRVHHLGCFAELEDQLCQWVPGDTESPDRLDALVWACTELITIPEITHEEIIVHDAYEENGGTIGAFPGM